MGEVGGGGSSDSKRRNECEPLMRIRPGVSVATDDIFQNISDQLSSFGSTIAKRSWHNLVAFPKVVVCESNKPAHAASTDRRASNTAKRHTGNDSRLIRAWK
jgi:hypothetical protein